MNFSTKLLLQRIRNQTMFGYKQWDLSVQNEIKAKFSSFSQIFKSIDITRKDSGEYLKTNAEKTVFQNNHNQSSFNLTNGTLLTPLFIF